MRHVRVEVRAHGAEASIHPVYDIWANGEFVERSRALQWNYADGVLGVLHYARGDADAFEAAVSEVPQVLDYDVERAGTPSTSISGTRRPSRWRRRSGR